MSNNTESTSPESEAPGIIRESADTLGDGLLKLVLSLAFCLVFAPVALIARLLNGDRLQRAFDADSQTYRRESRKASRDRLGTTNR